VNLALSDKPTKYFQEGRPENIGTPLFCTTAGVSQVILSAPLDCRGVSYTLISFCTIWILFFCQTLALMPTSWGSI